MAETIRDLMTPDPITVDPSASVREAAEKMRDADVGTMIVAEGDDLRGLVTDRDIVVRAIADGRDPDDVKVEEIATTDLVTLSPDDPIDDAVRTMRERDVRRLPVAEDGEVVGIVSLGDLAIEEDADSVLADISSEPPNN